MTPPYLTVLTTPILPPATRWYRAARRAVRPLARPGVPLPEVKTYHGHYALTRSIVEGLRAIGADFNFDPTTFQELARVVYAPANEALAQAVALKRQGRIDTLVAGPVNALLRGEADNVLLAPEVDLWIVASEWVVDLYTTEVPEIVHKLRVCPCGVDARTWAPSGAQRTRQAVVYWKSGDEAFCDEVERIVRAAGLEPVRVRSRLGEHHHFSSDGFRQTLDRAVLAVFLSSFETQGIALAEAWSMNVPTLVWNPRGQAEWRGRTFHAHSSAPYLTPRTGVMFQTLQDLQPALERALASLREFSPRAWVLEHMTDAICSAELFRIIRDADPGRS